MIKVIDVDYIEDFKLKLKFNDGIKILVDINSYLDGDVFRELKNHENFIQFGLTATTIEWFNGADFAPEFLYEIGIPIPETKYIEIQ